MEWEYSRGTGVSATDGSIAIYRLQDHTQRLFNSAKVFLMSIPWTHAQLNEAQREVVRANKLQESCYLRPIAFYGSEKMGVAARGQHGARGDRRVALGRVPRRRGHGGRHPRENVVVPAASRQRRACRAKACGNYINSILANQERR
jgi:branched-chain amino acid aminotransferase